MIAMRRIDGPALQAAREVRGLRQAQVADGAGVTRPFYHRLEKGTRKTTNITTIAKIAALLEVPSEQITRPVVTPAVGPAPADESALETFRRVFGAPEATVEQIVADYLHAWNRVFDLEALLRHCDANGIAMVPVDDLRAALYDDHDEVD